MKVIINEVTTSGDLFELICPASWAWVSASTAPCRILFM
jgi:hypothetical protein